MVNPLTRGHHATIDGALEPDADAAAVGMPTNNQFQAFRKFVLNEFGNQGLLPELEALVQQHGQERNGQAKTAGKGVPR